MKSLNQNKQRGVALMEIVVTVTLFVLIVGMITAFQRDIFSFNSFIQADLNAQISGRRAVTTMVSEMREMAQSSLGAYPIGAAATSTITFYSDIDADNVTEQVRYYIQSGNVMKSVVNPSGNPLTYNQGSAAISTIARNIGNGTSTPLFQYFDTNYAGTSTPLTIPINVASVKLVKINLILNREASTQPEPLVFTSQVSLRNLKDNL